MSETELLLTIIPIVVALSGILSPVLVAHLNNSHQLKMRKLELDFELTKSQAEMFYSCKKNAYDNLLQAIGKQLQNTSIVDWRNLRSAINSAILYANKENQILITDFLKELDSGETSAEKMTELAKSLNDDLQNTYSVINRSWNSQK